MRICLCKSQPSCLIGLLCNDGIHSAIKHILLLVTLLFDIPTAAWLHCDHWQRLRHSIYVFMFGLWRSDAFSRDLQPIRSMWTRRAARIRYCSYLCSLFPLRVKRRVLRAYMLLRQPQWICKNGKAFKLSS